MDGQADLCLFCSDMRYETFSPASARITFHHLIVHGGI